MNEGTVNHDSGPDWTMSNLTVSDNGGAGIFLGAGNVARYNCLMENSQYGFQAYSNNGGEGGMVLEFNEIRGNNTGDWETKEPGCGCTGGGKFWDVRDVRVAHNYVHHNKSVGLWADTNNNNFVFESNWISDNEAQGIFWETSYNVAIRNNVLQHNLTKAGPDRIADGDNFPDAAIYISEGGGDARLEHGLVGSATVDIVGNLIEDNYNGITLWENADRFCGSPANTSSDYCTLVDPEKVNLSTCTEENIADLPYLSDCRWKSQNVKVHDNTFKMNRANFFDCPKTMCGFNSILSNWGTYPSWSPYQGDVIEKEITFDQGNKFFKNTYVGSWQFVVLESGKIRTSEEWIAPPYEQDNGSTFTN
jgi:parallel beta-helix repeat protein